jgi:hypothetical protein
MPNNGVPAPNIRRLRGYSFDPSLSVQLDTAVVNEAVFKVRWEQDLKQGPVGEYLEVVDYDPASKYFYDPVDLNNSYILAQDGLAPSESCPQFHQQMVYAVAMTTIQNFEKALGRKALWSSYRDAKEREFLPRLRVYPHALRQANAYYSPAKKALLFGYFPASPSAPGDHIPNGIVFTCLSHDIIAHETTHALLDGMHRRFIENSHRDTLAFHEAFADIVALFQHFSFPEVLRQQIAKTRGDLASQSLLGQLAQQFGKAIGQYGALRDAIGEFDPKEKRWKPREPDPNDYQTELEPHSRGAILVAAVFEAFLSIYKRRIADLLRIASNGTGILTPGELHPDLVDRLADEAAKSAQHVLTMCIRALDYCPPVDITFGDYLRAIITADADLFAEDERGYRIAFIEAFRRRGIYPRDIRTLSQESLSWSSIHEDDQQVVFKFIASSLRFFIHHLSYLDQFPNLEQLELDDRTYVDFLRKERLIPNLEQRWQAIPDTERGKLWNYLFAHQQFTPPFIFKPYPATKPWSEFGDHDEASAATVVWQTMSDREKIFNLTSIAKSVLHRWLYDFKADANADDVKKFEELTGLYLFETPERKDMLSGLESDSYRYSFEVHSFRGAQRTAPDGTPVNRVIVSITQKRMVPVEEPTPAGPAAPAAPGAPTAPVAPAADTEEFAFRGGCTMVFDLNSLKLKYVVKKLIDDSDGRLKRQREYRTGEGGASLRATYFGPPEEAEPFALLHSDV